MEREQAEQQLPRGALFAQYTGPLCDGRSEPVVDAVSGPSGWESRPVPTTKSARASGSLASRSMMPGRCTTDSPSRSTSSTQYFPGASRIENPPVSLVVARWRCPVATLTTSTVRPSSGMARSDRIVPRSRPVGWSGLGCCIDGHASAATGESYKHQEGQRQRQQRQKSGSPTTDGSMSRVHSDPLCKCIACFRNA